MLELFTPTSWDHRYLDWGLNCDINSCVAMTTIELLDLA